MGSAWLPGERAYVCSLHFKLNDNNPNCKQRKLLPSAVPSIFSNYPRYVLPKETSKRKSPKKRCLENIQLKKVDNVDQTSENEENNSPFREITTFESIAETAMADAETNQLQQPKSNNGNSLYKLNFLSSTDNYKTDMHSNFRDSQAWADENLFMSYGSNESCKLYDAALSQYVGWYDDPALGSLDETLKRLSASDPKFIMGRVFINGLDLIGTGKTTRLDKQFQAEIESLFHDSQDDVFTLREKKHVQAIKYFADGLLTKAAETWEDILVDYPTDMLALKFAHDTYFYLGNQLQIRDSVARVLPFWKNSLPLYSYLYGMLAFGLEENNFYDKALDAAKKGLEMNKKDGWATHAIAHVLEMTGKQEEGINFLNKTLDDWTYCGMLACHNYWHLGLYYIEKGEYNEALEVFDNELSKRANSGSMLDIVDTTSFLYRLELEGVNIDKRWQRIMELCQPHLGDHITVFNDAHFLMACLGSKNKDHMDFLMHSAADYLKSNNGTNAEIMRTTGMPILNSFIAFNAGNYSKAFDLLYPHRYKIFSIGGSHAQRDLFNQLLIAAAINSPVEHHKKVARLLLAERKALKENSPLTDRLTARMVALHSA